MKPRLPILFGAISVPAALLVSGARSAPTEPASVVPTLESDVPGTEKSPVPTAKEWQSAAHVKLSRTSAAGATCDATRVREWLRVRCPIETFAISLLGGSNDSLSFWIGAAREGQPGEVQFPLRRGDRRVIQLWTQKAAADGSLVPEPSIVIQEQWIEGEPSPTVTVL